VPASLTEPGTTVDVESESGHLVGTIATIPFIDPKKEEPAKPLA
jgi:hypothetical protein